jgi:wyosine [tRNA(Phe)-imidazoG37] synthetase (radical SAM superfamily)
MIAFGPVPSRRLGRSLGINNIPPKICTYACAYCQLGRTIKMQTERQPFYEPKKILQDIRDKVEKASQAGEPIDYLTFVPDGEPTLDINLGREIALLKQLGIKIAVITNSSLMWHEEVREALAKADWVSLKMDAVREGIWRRIDRPHGTLRLSSIQDGMLGFAKTYTGHLATETMLVEGVNDSEEHLAEVADFLARLQPGVAYLSIPTRPPAEKWVQPPQEKAINRAYQILGQRVGQVEFLIGYEGNAFASTGDIEQDLLSITAVHPMREDAVDELLARAQHEQPAEADWTVVRRLVAQDQLVEAEYGGHRFYLRRLRGHSKNWD